MLFTIWTIGYIISCILVLGAVMYKDAEEDHEPSKYLGMVLVGFIILSPIWFIWIPAVFIANELED